MKRYPKLRPPGEEETRGLFADGTIVIQEKLDGANFRFTWEPGEGFTFGSRRTEGEGLNREQFEDAIEYIEENANESYLKTQYEDFGKLVYFGECMNPHTISYDWEATPDFLGFDIWSEDAQQFLTTMQVEGVFDDLGLPTAPIVATVNADNWENYDFECPESEYYDGLAEGVVFKNHSTSTYGKFVRDDFKEKNKQKFGKSKKEQESGAEKLAYQYITEARIEKTAYKLRDEGEYDDLKMEMMRDLPEAVIRDMAEEEAGNLFMDENWEVDIPGFRSTVSSRCAAVLRRLIDKQIKEAL